MRRLALAENKTGGDYMSITEIYEKVNLEVPIEQRRFLNYLNDTVNELMAMYNNFVINKGSEYTPITSLSEKDIVLPLYHEAIVDNIIFLVNGEESRKNEFIRKSRNAFLKYWNDNARCRKLKKAGW